MANWRYTNIQHPARIALGLTVVEYCVLDIVYQSQTHPSHTKNGWSDAGCHTIGKFLGLSSGTVKGIFDRLEKFGFMERGVGVLKRTTADFHDVAYIQNEDEIGSVQKLNVQKLNDKRSKAERASVQMLNGKRSKAEHISKLKEVESNSKVNNVETSLSTVVHDQVDEIELQVHDVIVDNAALLPQLDVDEEKKKVPVKKKRSAAAKNPDPTPINAMWDILLEQSAKIGNEEPQFMSRYGRDFKLLYAILKQRAEKRQEPITDQVEPFRRYVTKIVDYIIKGRKVPQHQFTANNLARNFNPGYLHTSFNQICATIQSGVTVTNQPNTPTAYNESEVYRNFNSSQAAF